MDTSAHIRALKRALRGDVRARLNALAPDVVKDESRKVLTHLFNLREYRQSESVSVYLTMTGGVSAEIETEEIVTDLFKREDFRSLPKNKWGIAEPPLEEARENALEKDGLDLIIVPGLAFDREGWRLGHGKGYYDRYFAKVAEWSALAGRPIPKTVALALAEQIVDTPLPREDFDQKPEVVITPAGPLSSAST
ncbi:uncharacterized protein EV422DRAFT_571587 [Fimicolochytrium jonesii]|uniref:uncharacterized protein n=1 Tax=Fimicolochytrium jonesii TaxID=1396493 RepID=UPI0022FEC94A|nr:uncharacterized protein EV422DRAFT_571587 [Fimicolochytrium jonesii]KAI8816617.1 hypothetical protein EV422DRAFT_571587 [Fimicolochytrium jonesii]